MFGNTSPQNSISRFQIFFSSAEKGTGKVQCKIDLHNKLLAANSFVRALIQMSGQNKRSKLFHALMLKSKLMHIL